MGNDTKRRLAVAAAFLVAATAASRVLGLFREQIALYYLGLGASMGAFTVAFKVPSLVRTLLADTALSAAFIPVFSELLQKERRREAWQVARTVTVLATAVLGILSILGVVFAPQVIRLAAPGYKDPETIALAISLTRIMFPTVVILGVAGIFMGILNSYDHFTLPALAPIAWNVVIIASVAVFARKYGFYALAWGVTIGTVVELLLQIPAVWGKGRGTGGTLSLRHPAVRRVGVLLGPVVLTLGIINFNALVDTIVASYISEPAPAVIDKAFRLFTLPEGMFAVAIGTVLFPTLARLAAGRRYAEFRETVMSGVRQIFFVILPFAALFVVLGVPTVRVIFQHGKVTPANTEEIAWALAMFSLGMPFVGANDVLNRAFYGIQKTYLPLLVGGVNLVLNAGLDLLLYRPLGVGGITLSTALVSTFYTFALLFLLRRQVGELAAKQLALTVGRSLVALVPLCALGWGVWWLLDGWLGRSNPAQIVTVGGGYAAGLAVYAAVAWLFRMEELGLLVRLVKRRRDPRVVDEVSRSEDDTEV